MVGIELGRLDDSAQSGGLIEEDVGERLRDSTFRVAAASEEYDSDSLLEFELVDLNFGMTVSSRRS